MYNIRDVKGIHEKPIKFSLDILVIITLHNMMSLNAYITEYTECLAKKRRRYLRVLRDVIYKICILHMPGLPAAV